MGTPNTKIWPGLADLPEWKDNKYEIFPPEKLANLVPKMPADGLDLLD